jgi:hypothetical protein
MGQRAVPGRSGRLPEGLKARPDPGSPGRQTSGFLLRPNRIHHRNGNRGASRRGSSNTPWRWSCHTSRRSAWLRGFRNCNWDNACGYYKRGDRIHERNSDLVPVGVLANGDGGLSVYGIRGSGSEAMAAERGTGFQRGWLEREKRAGCPWSRWRLDNGVASRMAGFQYKTDGPFIPKDQDIFWI